MTDKYHGTPITPKHVMETLKGFKFCVSFVRPDNIKWVAENASGVMLDNGAFSAWRRGANVSWPAFYTWAEKWLEIPSSWAVIPDIIGGSDEDNDKLLQEWPHSSRGAPVWHVHSPVERLIRLTEEWPRVCIGSSGDYKTVGAVSWHRRMQEVFDRLYASGPPEASLHMLRGMRCLHYDYPFNSVDSADIARNHNRGSARAMALRWEGLHCPTGWR